MQATDIFGRLTESISSFTGKAIYDGEGIAIQSIRSDGSTPRALANLRMLFGYIDPPFSALETVFLDTPALSARSVTVNTLRRLSFLSVSTFTSTTCTLPIVPSSFRIWENIYRLGVYTWDKVGIMPPDKKKLLGSILQDWPRN